MEAGAALLARDGLRGTTTAAVAARAEVSEGALFKHFPTKVELLAACVEQVLAGLVDEFRAGLPRRRPPTLEGRVRLAVAELWRVFGLPPMQGLFEVYLAARTDPDLSRAIEPLLEAHGRRIHDEARALLPELAAHAALEQSVDAIVWAMQGAAIGPFTRDASHALAFFERLALDELRAAAAPRSNGKGRR